MFTKLEKPAGVAKALLAGVVGKLEGSTWAKGGPLSGRAGSALAVDSGLAIHFRVQVSGFRVQALGFRV